jgi:hypothetical protein
VPETIEDRALAVRLRRKAKGESVERFRAAKVAELEGLRRRCARWSKDNLLRLRGIDPSVPETLNDRAQDNARALLAIADTAGGHWPNTLRAALVGNSALQSNDDPESVGALLLRDINDIFVGASKDRLGSEALAEKLAALEESPWATWRKGFPITPRNVKKLLEPYEIKPGRDRFGAFYAKADFADALERYVAESTPEIPSHPSHPSQRHTSVTAKPSENNELLRNDGCDGYSGVTDDNLHDPSQPEVASVTAGPIVTDFDLSNDPGNPEAWS